MVTKSLIFTLKGQKITYFRVNHQYFKHSKRQRDKKKCNNPYRPLIWVPGNFLDLYKWLSLALLLLLVGCSKAFVFLNSEFTCVV